MASDDLFSTADDHPSTSSSVSATGAGAAGGVSGGGGGWRKVKLLCSYGGQILPRPSDNILRYVGGETRIVTVRRDTSLPELLRKMSEAHGGGGPVLVRYQLPDEDLDALISVSTQEDLDNMMDEYDKVVCRDSSAKIRVFLFTPAEVGLVGAEHYFGSGDLVDVSAKYLEAVNGVERKDSVASFSSNGTAAAVEVGDEGNVEGMGVNVVSPTNASVYDQSRSYFRVKNGDLPLYHGLGDQNEMMMNAGQSELPSVGTYLPQVYVEQHPTQFVNPQSYVVVGMRPVVNVVGVPPQTNMASNQVVPPVSTQVTNGVPVQMRMEPNLEGNNNGTKLPRPPSDPKLQPLSQLPPLPPPHLLAPSGDRSGMRQSPLMSKGLAVKLEDCSLCQRALPHVHSDTLLNDHANGSKSTVSSPVLQSHHSDNMARTEAQVAVSSGATVDSHLEKLKLTSSLESYGFMESSPEVLGGNERQVVQNVEGLFSHNAAPNGENHDQAKLFSQPSSLPVSNMHLMNSSLAHQLEFSQEHMPFTETIGLAQNSVKQDAVAGSTIFCESPDSRKGQLIHENFSVPANSSVYIRPTAAVVDALFGSSKEACGFSQQLTAVVLPENGTTKESKPKISPLVVENNQNFKPQYQVSTMPISSSVVPSDIILEQNVSPPVDPLPPTTWIHAGIQNLHSVNTSHMPHIAGNNAHSDHHEAGVVTTGLTPHVYDSRMPSMNPIGNRKVVDPNVQFNNAFSDPTISACGNTQINVAINAAHPEKLQESTSSNSLFFNDDPQKILGSTPALSTRPSISIKEPAFMKDLYPENTLIDRKGLDAGIPSEGTYFSQSPDPASKNLLVETVWSLQDSEQVEQDMQVSAESKKVLGPSLSKPPRASSHEYKKPTSPNGEYDNNVKTDDEKSENIKFKQSDKGNYGFPNVDEGHLQVIHNSDLEELRELGSGTFGTVYHGKWRGTDVAIKRLNDRVFSGKQSEQDRAKTDFWNEACKLASLHHPNVVAFYGIVFYEPGGPVATVTEFMVNGSLRTALQKNERTLDRRKCLIIAMDVAFGMEYLHSKDIIHFDLKSDNLLVNLRDPQRPICKVGDLGLSKLKYETLMSGGMRGTLPWMAPEILGGKKHTEKVDVFSFGIVMWELLTGEEPYADLHYGAIIGGIINNTLRPPVPESCDPEWRSLMEQCWSNDPSERPSFTDIANRLRQMAASLPQKK